MAQNELVAEIGCGGSRGGLDCIGAGVLVFHGSDIPLDGAGCGGLGEVVDCVFGALALCFLCFVSAPGWVVDVRDDGGFHFRSLEGVASLRLGNYTWIDGLLRCLADSSIQIR